LANINKGTARAEIGTENLKDGTQTIYLSEIVNKTKGNKNASQLLDELIKHADETDTPISLRANVSNNFTDGKGLSQQQLIDWYKRKGFKPANELSDFTGDKDFMVYQPKPSIPQQPLSVPKVKPTIVKPMQTVQSELNTSKINPSSMACFIEYK
jgi:hypothetical protein